MKMHGEPYRAKSVTLVTAVYIPELAGYWEESFDVLKVCLNSVFENTDAPYDLLVFDNGSCTEVREYLLGLHHEGRIQYLFLAHDNVAKLGCFNQVFPGVPGEYIGFFDCDVYFYPGWLSASLKVFQTFDRVGTVTARPGRQPGTKDDQLTATLEFADRAEGGVVVERGDLIPSEILRQHLASIGLPEDHPEANDDDIRMTLDGVSVYVYGSHFQFLTKRTVAAEVLPIPLGDHPLGSDRLWDLGVNSRGYLRLGLDKPYVRHIGNSLKGEERITDPTGTAKRGPMVRRKRSGPIRRIFVRLHSMLSRALYS